MSKADKLVSKDIQEKGTDLRGELERLRRYLNYKNSKFCKRVLDEIIRKYFKNEKEE
jgi:phosphopantetheinyl transferase (holo-ACP synthase)